MQLPIRTVKTAYGYYRESTVSNRRLPNPDFSHERHASDFVRSALGVGRLNRQQMAGVRRAVALHAERAANKPEIARPGRMTAMLQKRIAGIVRPMVGKLYRVSESRWAGGGHTTTISLADTPSAAGWSEKAWSENGKWTGTDSYMRIQVSTQYMTAIASVEGLRDAGGMITTHAERAAENLWRASWVEQGRGFGLNIRTGYIYRDGNGWHHAASERSARLAAARRVEFEARIARKQALLRMSAAELTEKFGDATVIRRDSLRAGNCAPGTDSWIAVHLPGRETATVAEIVAADSGNPSVKRAVIAAIIRQRKA